jgi:hypothetical protein
MHDCIEENPFLGPCHEKICIGTYFADKLIHANDAANHYSYGGLCNLYLYEK